MQINEIVKKYKIVMEAENADESYSEMKDELMKMWKEYLNERKDMFFIAISPKFVELAEACEDIMDLNIAEIVGEIIDNSDKKIPEELLNYIFEHNLEFLLCRSNIINEEYFINYINDKLDKTSDQDFLKDTIGFYAACNDINAGDQKVLNLAKKMNSLMIFDNGSLDNEKISQFTMILLKLMLSDKLTKDLVYDNLDLFDERILFNPKFKEDNDVVSYFSMRRRAK